jgi:nitroimidazol reductase NimA-like FMN-containing flavoprotein (pyridoxamine 5'-phosphate oxidase superfamily)
VSATPDTAAPQPDSAYSPTGRTTLRRHRERARYDRDLVHAILDEALVAHVGFTSEHGPIVLPMVHARLGDDLYFHGARANALLGALKDGVPACATVTIVDGLVLARSAFHHSMNFRCVTIFGVATEVTDPEEVRRASTALVDHLVPGRGDLVRAPDDGEVRRTLFVRMPIDEVSAKVRTGGPVDEEADLALDVWAGHLPLETTAGPPVADVGVSAPWPHASSVDRRRS